MTNNTPFPMHKHEFIRAQVLSNTGSQTFKFDRNETLKGKLITGITFHPNSYLTTDPDGNTLVATAVSTNKGFLTLKNTEGVEDQNKIPLYLLAAGVTPGGTYEKAFPFAKLQIDVDKSYVWMSGANILTANTVFLFSVWYIDQPTVCK